MARVRLNGSYFQTIGPVIRRRINDWPEPVPSQGVQDAATRYLRNALSFGGITDGFAGRSIGPWSRESIARHLAHGDLHIAHDSEAETRFEFITLPRQRNTLTMPTRGMTGTEQTSSIFGQAMLTFDVGGQALTRQQYNDRPAKFYAGSTTAGVYCWEAQSDQNILTARVYTFAWTGSAFSSQVQLFDVGNVTATTALFDYEVHKGTLFAVGTTNRLTTPAGNAIRTTTDGASWSDPGTEPTTIAFLEGTRFIDNGNTLWLIVQGGSQRIDMAKSTDTGATWTNYANVAVGQVRSVFRYRDLSNTERMMVMTEDKLYWLDDTNNKLVAFFDLLYRGRAATVWGGYLFLALDGLRVVRYFQGDGPAQWTFIDPGGGEAMPSGKDFGFDTDAAVVVANGSLGPIFAWGGDGSTAGTLNRVLCLQWVQKAEGEGWHFIFRLADTTNDVGYSPRALFLDPTSGDLLYLGANVSSSNEARSHDTVRIIKAETDPRRLAANINETAGYIEEPLVTLPPTAISSTAFDLFLNSENVDADDTINPAFGTNDDAATTTAFGAQTSDRVTVNFNSGLGTNFTTMRKRYTFAGTATTGPVLYNAEMQYLKVPDERWTYTTDIVVEPRQEGNTERVDTFALLNTISSSKTKVNLQYGGRSVNVLTISSEMQEFPEEELNAVQEARNAVWRFVFAEA